MTTNTTQTAAIPAVLVLVIMSCLVRAAWATWNILQFSRYLLNGQIGLTGFLAFTAVDAIIWAALGIGLWRLSKPFRVATMAWCGVAIALSGFGLLSTMMRRPGYHYSYALVVVLLAVDFAIIAYLSQAGVKHLFEGGDGASLAAQAGL